MPLMEGGCLANALRNMSWAPRAECLGQIVTAVSFLHGKKMVHRDIKSSNILLDRVRRHARLADFGLAKDQVKGSRHGTTGIVVGSPGYMAPELMMRPANEKTDAFALGVVILEILTGQPAWDEAWPLAMLLSQMASSTPPWSMRKPPGRRQRCRSWVIAPPS
ncbi:Interleukin-1 receptor-associated kinase 4 (IRAK-4) (Renal carcinoma antigen NY-REN-64) [Durusdinium trenchii]|uniref:Interleukin-1 receptor-associated kinase 4 (IRAK-4) (Renal carcinoma antigen NY-REN-64) n=1 Tax=Durusdinium trenchii TaxID=1381693 RepID=A0ABP0M5R3_9DINO